MTLLQIIEGAFVGKTVRFSHIPGGQSWIGEHVVKIESIEFDIVDAESGIFKSESMVADFSLRRLEDGEVLHLYNAPLDTVSIEEVKE